MDEITQNGRSLRPAVFLDRDGTINVEKDYLFRAEDFEFIPGAPDAIKALKDAGYLVVVVTNQSGVARGYYTLEDVNLLHEYIQAEIGKHGTSIDAFYLCPHHPTKGVNEFARECECRKPKPGMLNRASEDLQIDLARSIMIGDKLADIEAGEAVGCQPLLVLTGYGEQTRKKIVVDNCKVFDHIGLAANYVCELKK
jgi:D-glycero-D-manno-heptose 1,7-bisphosphate phosphatase